MSNKSINTLGASYTDPLIADIVFSPAHSDWLKALMQSGIKRDPLDVIHDLQLALQVFESVFERAILAADSLDLSSAD